MAATPPDLAQPRLMRAALAAAERGWHVFPLQVGRKIPALRDWEQLASTDPDTIWRWWHHAPYNIGIATGRSGLVVVDLDPARGERLPTEWATHQVRHGRDVFEILARRAGTSPPTATFTVRTPRRGLHLYFTSPEGTVLRNTAGKLGWHIDTRAGGGYIVAPGSVVNGRRYQVIKDTPLVALPQWILDRIHTKPPVPQPSIELAQGNTDAYGAAAILGETERVAQAGVGARNHTLFTAAARLGELVAGGAIRDTDARQALEQACERHIGIAGFTETEAARTIDSGLRRGSMSPRKPRDRREASAIVRRGKHVRPRLSEVQRPTLRRLDDRKRWIKLLAN